MPTFLERGSQRVYVTLPKDLRKTTLGLGLDVAAKSEILDFLIFYQEETFVELL